MKLRFPAYYLSFRCACGSCPDTCCASWRVILDDKALARYRAVSGEFGQRLQNSLCVLDGETCFQTQNGVCPMLTSQGLCSVQLTLGEDALCAVCRRYPRWRKTYGSLVCQGLSLSCPQAARLALSWKGPVPFLTDADQEPVTEYNTLDPALFFLLSDARRRALTLAQDRELPLSRRMMLLLSWALELQGCLRYRQMEKAKTLCANLLASDAASSVPGFSREAQLRHLAKLTAFLQTLEILTPQWRQNLCDLAAACSEPSPFFWDLGLTARLAAVYPEEEQQLEQVLVYFLDQYLLTACYDRDLLGKVKLSVFSVFFLHQLALLHLCRYGRFTLDDQVELVHRYCRELEHSEENMAALAAAMRSRPLFDTRRLLRTLSV